MNLRAFNWALAVSLSALLCAATAFAQAQQQEPSPLDPNAPLQPLNPNPQPAPGAGSPSRPPAGAARGVSSPYDPQQYDPSQVVPDQNTLAGAAPFTLGELQHNRNIFDPAISYSQIGQTYSLTDGKSIVTDSSLVSGSLNFDRTWSEYHLSVLYNGGETFNYGYGTQAPVGIAARYQFHSLIFTQEADWKRWHVLLRDNFNVSPGATFTGQGMGGPGLAAQFSSLLGGSLTNLSQLFLPSETINTADAERYMNSVLGQVAYSFTRRSAVTVAGSYGLLNFTVPGFFNSTMVNGQVGYDYLLDPRNSIAVLGSYGNISFTGTRNTTMDYVGALAYGRKITGRVAFQAAVGPQEIQSSGGPLGTFHLLFVSANSALRYERRRSGLSFTFLRGLTEGSGLFQGATSDTFSANAHYQFTRHWSGSVNAGYALNNALAPSGAKAAQFDNWFAGANLSRRVGLHAQFNFNYGAQDQTNPPGCTPVTCGLTGLQQTVGLSVNWHLRPVGYEQ
jgi:hypothetical protein